MTGGIPEGPCDQHPHSLAVPEDTYLQSLLTVCHNQAFTVLNFQGEFDEAQEELDASLAIYEALAASDPANA